MLPHRLNHQPVMRQKASQKIAQLIHLPIQTLVILRTRRLLIHQLIRPLIHLLIRPLIQQRKRVRIIDHAQSRATDCLQFIF